MEYEVRVRKVCPDCKGDTVYSCPEYERWWQQVAERERQEGIFQWQAIELLRFEEPTCGMEEHPCRTCEASGYVESWMPVSHLLHFLEIERARA